MSDEYIHGQPSPIHTHCRERIKELEADRDKAWVLLTWAEALIRSLSGWPETHSNEVVEWKEEWRLLRMRRKQRSTIDETDAVKEKSDEPKKLPSDYQTESAEVSVPANRYAE